MIAEAATTVNPQVEFAKLRAWINEHCFDKDPVRKSSYVMALSAVAHRLLKYGPDETMNSLSSRDLMCLLIYTNGLMAEYLMRTAYFRAIIEGQHDIYEYMNTTMFIAECRAWYWQIAEAVMGRAPDPVAVGVWLENMKGEELAVARLIISRIYPDLAHISWLDDISDTTSVQGARAAAELCSIMLQKKDYKAAVERFLREHPHVRHAI